MQSKEVVDIRPEPVNKKKKKGKAKSQSRRKKTNGNNQDQKIKSRGVSRKRRICHKKRLSVGTIQHTIFQVCKKKKKKEKGKDKAD